MGGKQSISSAGEVLHEDEYLVSPTGTCFAILQSDGNFVIYKGSGPDHNERYLWGTQALGPGPAYVAVGTDGNLAVRAGTSPSPPVRWMSSPTVSASPGTYTARLEDDGRLVVRRKMRDGDPDSYVWSTPRVLGSKATPDGYAPGIKESYQRQEPAAGGDTVRIVAVRAELKHDVLPVGKNLAVFADVIVVKEKLELHGRNLTLCARQLVIEDGASIDLSGLPPASGPTTRAKDGDDGQPGTAGQAGTKGNEGAWCLLVAQEQFGALDVISNGSAGGRGQDGGNGGRGLTGARGKDGFNTDRIWPPTAGDPGHTGGRGGDAGRPGDGGPGGGLSTLIGTGHDSISASVSGGRAGDVAGPGLGGPGGSGGPGGQFMDSRYIASPHGTGHYEYFFTGKFAESGATGAKGSDGSTPTANAGPDGTRKCSEADSIAQWVKDHAPPTYAPMLLRQAEMSYVSGDLAVASRILTWIRTFAPADRATLLLTQMRQGLNYYGQRPNQVPLVNLKNYESQVSTLLAMGGSIEQAVQQYTRDAASQTDKRNALDAAVKASEQLQAQAGNAIAALSKQEQQLQDDIAGLRATRSTQMLALQVLAPKFNQAAEQRALSFKFEDVVHCVKAMVAVGKLVNGDISAAGTVYSELKDTYGAFTRIGDAVTNLQVLAQDAADLTQQWRAIKPEVMSTDRADKSKLVILQEDFDKQIKPYLDLDVAKDYRDAMHDYIGTCQAVNGQLLEYTRTVTARLAIAAAMAQRAQEIAAIETQMAAGYDPTLEPHRTFMAAALEHALGQALRHLYAEHAAYRYWCLDDTPFAVAPLTMAALADKHGNLVSSITDVLNAKSGPTQPFKEVAFRLDDTARPEQFAAFRAGYPGAGGRLIHDLTFTIPLGDPKAASGFLPHYAHVLVTNFKIEVPGLVTKDEGGLADVRFMHSGRVVLRSERGDVHDFTHSPLTANYLYEVASNTPKGGGHLGGDGDEYIGLSPYASWTIRIREDENTGVDLSGVHSVVIKFDGRYRLMPGFTE